MSEMDRWNEHTEAFPEEPWPDNFLDSLREFFAADHQRPVGLDLYEDCFTSGLFFPLQRRRELVKMIQLVRRVVGTPRTVLDIGTDKGAGLYHWVKCFPSVRKAVAIEIRGTPYAELFTQTFPDVRFLWCEASSHHQPLADRIAMFLASDPIDVLFLDGDKHGTEQDFRLYAPFVRSSGLVLIHDVNEEGHPRETFDKLAETYRSETIIDTSESAEASERIARGESATTPHENWLRYWKGRSAGVGVLYL